MKNSFEEVTFTWIFRVEKFQQLKWNKFFWGNKLICGLSHMQIVFHKNFFPKKKTKICVERNLLEEQIFGQ